MLREKWKPVGDCGTILALILLLLLLLMLLLELLEPLLVWLIRLQLESKDDWSWEDGVSGGGDNRGGVSNIVCFFESGDGDYEE